MSSSSRERTGARVLRDVSVVTPADSRRCPRASRARSWSIPALIESALRDGRQSGYDDGYGSGYADGLAEARSRTEDLAERLIGLVPQLGDAASELYEREATARDDIEDQVVGVAFEIAQVLVGHELDARRATPAATRSPGRWRSPPTRVTSSPGCIPTTSPRSAIPTTSRPAGRSRSCADAGLRPGDCVVDVNGCHIDARIDSALERIRVGPRPGHRRSPYEPPPRLRARSGPAARGGPGRARARAQPRSRRPAAPDRERGLGRDRPRARHRRGRRHPRRRARVHAARRPPRRPRR